MKPKPDHHDPRLEDQDPVWQLLARAPRPEPDGWFTARTLARCRQVERQLAKSWMPLGRVWRWALGGGLGVCLASILMVTQVQTRPPAADPKTVQEAFQIVATVGSDTDSSSTTSTWPDSSL